MKQLTEEAEELKTSSASAKEEAAAAKQELEQARSHIETIQSKLQAALLEVEVMKASEESALSQVSANMLKGYRHEFSEVVLHATVMQHVPVNLQAAW